VRGAAEMASLSLYLSLDLAIGLVKNKEENVCRTTAHTSWPPAVNFSLAICLFYG
jgi:hypothetical protein